LTLRAPKRNSSLGGVLQRRRLRRGSGGSVLSSGGSSYCIGIVSSCCSSIMRPVCTGESEWTIDTRVGLEVWIRGRYPFVYDLANLVDCNLLFLGPHRVFGQLVDSLPRTDNHEAGMDMYVCQGEGVERVLESLVFDCLFVFSLPVSFNLPPDLTKDRMMRRHFDRHRRVLPSLRRKGQCYREIGSALPLQVADFSW
ncbi:hypothetical protein CPB85DRAFT_1318335, partial [Mucidula mucida]